ncbi:hypothetical protein D3C76_1539410 [compost metagenome]
MLGWNVLIIWTCSCGRPPFYINIILDRKGNTPEGMIIEIHLIQPIKILLNSLYGWRSNPNVVMLISRSAVNDALYHFLGMQFTATVLLPQLFNC